MGTEWCIVFKLIRDNVEQIFTDAEIRLEENEKILAGIRIYPHAVLQMLEAYACKGCPQSGAGSSAMFGDVEHQ